MGASRSSCISEFDIRHQYLVRLRLRFEINNKIGLRTGISSGNKASIQPYIPNAKQKGLDHLFRSWHIILFDIQTFLSY